MKRMIMVLTLCLTFFAGLILPIQAQEKFIIEDANIVMVVHEDGRIDITERLQTKFLSEAHGIYRNIPSKYEMDWVEEGGDTTRKQYYFPVKNITCSTTCDIERNSDGVQIRLGDADTYINGRQNYTMSYTIETKDLDMGGKQMLYWNLISNFDTPIKHLSYQITMPKAFGVDAIFTSTGGYMEGGDLLTWNVDGNIISGETTGILYNNEAASIKVILPDNYFQFPVPNDYTVFGIVMGLIVLALSFILFIRYGKDDDVIVTVEFHAPEGLDSAGVGYVIDDAVDNRDIISLIIYWANNGFLKIHDEKNGFMLEKLKEMDKNNSKAYERTFFYALFSKGEKVSEAQLKNEKVRTGLNNAKYMLRNYFYQSKKRRIYTNTSLALQLFMLFMIILPLSVMTMLYGYEYYSIISMVLPGLIPVAILFVSCIPWIVLMRKHYAMKRSTIMMSSMGLFIVNGASICAVAWFIVSKYKASLIMTIVLAFITITSIIMMIFMDKRTKQGNRWLGQILGLKTFIMDCEKERLELLVQENPTAFYEILPYAYVLGVSDVWVKKFETIAIPEPDWYQGFGYGNGNIFMSMLWWNHFHYCFNDISSAVSYIPPATSGTGGGSFGGGGGFGGGGFSGGGFGGGGGGSW